MTDLVQSQAVQRSRRVEHIVRGTPTSDGAGVSLLRVFAQPWQLRLDPFLMLDAFSSDNPADYLAGFPPHPHRGFETVTYMLAGRLRHRDSTGGQGLLMQGGVQWMTAGAGIVHSEMPEQEQGLMRGFQLWLNLPAHQKMCPPGYRDIAAEEIRVLRLASGAEIHLVAGHSHDLAGPMQREITEPLYADVHLPAASELAHRLPLTHNAFFYVYEGAVQVESQTVLAGQMAVLENQPDADGVRLTAQSAARLLLIAGRPLAEPIAQYGPFVMNTREELQQAFEDYNLGRMGRLDT